MFSKMHLLTVVYMDTFFIGNEIIEIVPFKQCLQESKCGLADVYVYIYHKLQIVLDLLTCTLDIQCFVLL